MEAFASLERHSKSVVLQLLLAPGQASPAARHWVLLPLQHTEGWMGQLSCKAQSPHQLMDWWAGQADTEKDV